LGKYKEQTVRSEGGWGRRSQQVKRRPAGAIAKIFVKQNLAAASLLSSFFPEASAEETGRLCSGHCKDIYKLQNSQRRNRALAINRKRGYKRAQQRNLEYET
jgi:hypothetical protein